MAKARDLLTAELLEATADKLEAKSQTERVRQELTRLKQSLPASDAEGQVPDSEFYFRNIQWAEDGPHVDIIGEMQNRTGADWKSAWFQIAAYDESIRLLGVSSFQINLFSSGMVKAFDDTLIDVPYSRDMRFKITFEGGDESESE